mgnify:CR=1 FL=1
MVDEFVLANKYYLNTIYIMKLNLVNICLSIFFVFLIVFFLLLPHFRESKIEALKVRKYAPYDLAFDKFLLDNVEYYMSGFYPSKRLFVNRIKETFPRGKISINKALNDTSELREKGVFE